MSGTMRRKVTQTFCHVSRWLQGLSSDGKDPKDGREDCPKPLSHNDISDEALSDQAADEGSCPAAPRAGCALNSSPAGVQMGPRTSLTAAADTAHAVIRAELAAIAAILPADTSSKAVGHALAYVLHAKYHWRAKFCCATSGTRLPRMMPLAWLDDVVVVSPRCGVTYIVDLRFREKLSVRFPGPTGDQYLRAMLHSAPTVFVGSPRELFVELETWTRAIEALFAASGRPVPPWRCSRIFREAYTVCMECDATESDHCLKQLGHWSPSEETAETDGHRDCSCNAFADVKWDDLDALRAMVATHKVNLHPSCPDTEAEDFGFEKELPEENAIPLQSGLTGLLRGH